jgi:hypothetical protein
MFRILFRRVMAHFGFLAWTFGHLRTLQSAESTYEAQATAYNAKAERISADNTKIAEAAATVGPRDDEGRTPEKRRGVSIRESG